MVSLSVGTVVKMAKCENCQVKESKIMDRRTLDGVNTKILVCLECFNLDGLEFMKVRLQNGKD